MNLNEDTSKLKLNTNSNACLIKELMDANCIKMGNFSLKNGEKSKFYYDMKNLISYPRLLAKVGDAVFEMLDDFDIICGIPYGGLPIASYISTSYNKPMIILRDCAKTYGTQHLIEGEFKASDRCLIIDDVITTGFSLQNAITELEKHMIVCHPFVIFDRQENYSCSKPVNTLLCKNDVVKFRLKEISREKKSNVCFAADIQDPVKLCEMLDKIGSKIVICKIHSDIIQSYKHADLMKMNVGNGSFEHFKNNLINLSIKHNFLIMEDRKFNDISSIVNKQFSNFNSWVDLITAHSLIAPEVLRVLSGVLLVSNMSNNTYDFLDKSLELAKVAPKNVVGFITQERITYKDLVCMTPGISLEKCKDEDQEYRTCGSVDTDYIIVGRAIYNSEEPEKIIGEFLSKFQK